MRMTVLSALLTCAALPALAAPPVVVTDIPPVHALVAQVLGDLGEPVLLLEPGADEHDFQLRPSQMQAIADAGLIVWIGPDLTPWLERATKDGKAPMLSLLAAPGTRLQPYAAPDHGAEHEEEHGAEDAATSEDHDHDHSGADPHVWLDPGNALIWLPIIAAEMAKADPENAATYAVNAAAAEAGIRALDAEIAASLAPVAARSFVTYHNAYGYFAAHYGLAYDGAIADGEAAEPGAAHLAELQERLKAESITCVFPEVQHDPVLAAQLLEGTPTRLGPPLDPVGSGLPPGPGAYGALLRGLAGAMVACLAP